jgi:plasmid stabilization system protein ParE
MTFRVRLTREAEDDLLRMYAFILERDETDLALGEKALQAIRDGFNVLEKSPFVCRKADAKNPFLRELLIAFGAAGYIALFEIEDAKTVTVLAIRHQREDDYH